MDLEKYIAENTEFLQRIFEQLPANIFFKNLECKYQFLSESYCKALDPGEDGTIIGKTDPEIQRDKELGRFYYEDDLEIIRTGVGNSYVNEMMVGDEKHYYKIVKEPVKAGDGRVIGVIGIVDDITELTVLNQEMERLAHTDAMTGLYNRTYFEQWVERELPKAAYPLSVICADCNGLKKTNDTYGHGSGDALICEVASVLRDSLPAGCVAFRMGGDEFLLLCEHTTEAAAEQLIGTLKERVAERRVEGMPVSIAYGSYTIVDAKEDFGAACKAADVRMYENKKQEKRIVDTT